MTKKLFSIALAFGIIATVFCGCTSNAIIISKNNFFKIFRLEDNTSFSVIQVEDVDSVTPYLSTAEYKSNKTGYKMLDVVVDVTNNTKTSIKPSDFIFAVAKDDDNNKYYSACELETKNYTELSDTEGISSGSTEVLHLMFQIPAKSANYLIQISSPKSSKKYQINYTYGKKLCSNDSNMQFQRYIKIGAFDSAYALVTKDKKFSFGSDDLNFCKAGIYLKNGAYGDAFKSLNKCTSSYKLATKLKDEIKNSFAKYNEVYRYQNCSRCYSYIRVNNGVVSMVATQTGTEKNNYKYQIVKYKGAYYISKLSTSLKGIKKDDLLYKINQDANTYRVVGASKSSDATYCGAYKVVE